MELILLPGMDGTGVLFKPFLNVLSQEISTTVITYPCEQKLSYGELISYVETQLPKKTEFVLLAESFSGPIAYKIAKNENLKAIIFIASFIQPPNRLLTLIKTISFSFLIPKRLPHFILKFLLGNLAGKEHYELVNEALMKVKKEVLAFRMKEMANLPRDMTDTINKSIYIQAISDNLVCSKNADKISELSIESQIYKIEGSHFVLQVNPEKCSKIIQNEMNLLARNSTVKSGRDLKSETTTKFTSN